jgi:ribosomal protein L11 methyltransferase
MSQIRLFMRGARAELARIHDYLEGEFEEEGYPLSMFEIDEDADLFEVSLYVEADAVDSAQSRIENRVGADAFGLKIEREILGDIDWVALSLQGLKPVRVGRVLVHGEHDRAAVHINDIGIEIEAAQAFGTGHHGTTAGCLDMIQRVLKTRAPRFMLDLGAGSAVLAIALAKLTRQKVLATDIDPLAVRIARGNAEINHCAGLVDFAVATGFRSEAILRNAPFDLIVANILAGPLMQLAPEMRQHSLPGGDIILSGILDSQARAVKAAYVSNGFAFVTETHREGWTTLHLRRR